jgi:dTDP-glucose 4,6-dehydratase
MGGQKLRLDGGGKSVRVFIHMRDVASATHAIARGGTPGDCYHISGYELVSIRHLVETVLERLGKSFEECVEIGPERPGKDDAYLLDSFKLRSELGWRDTVSLVEGIDDVIGWARRFAADLPQLPSKYEHKA